MRIAPMFCLASLVATATATGKRRLEYVGDFHVTYYWIAEEDSRYAGQTRSEILFDQEGCEIARVSTGFRTALDREGTGRLSDGRVVNVAGRRPDGFRYVDLGTDCVGLGVAGIPLVPFRSVAADTRRLATGERLHLPGFKDLILTDGDAHGGGFVVDDVGAAIRGRRLDVFIGEERDLERFERLVPSNRPTPVYRLTGAPRDLLVSRP